MQDSVAGKIVELKREKNAVILVHNYQPQEVQEIADFLGDSLDLSRRAARTEADLIVFCGVSFMAETAALLSPEKTVLLPESTAGCPMADMIDAEALRDLKEKHPGLPVATYVNSTAEVKASSDICCTSANAEKIIRLLGADKVIFVPDMNLGKYVSARTGTEMVLWEGYCPIHVRITADDIERARSEHPAAEVLVHPECTPSVTRLADQVLSTTGMCRHARQTDSKEMIIGTETGLILRLERENPGKQFFPANPSAVCGDMKKTNLDKVVQALEEEKTVVKVEEPIRSRAALAIRKMLDLG